ncbi:MAG: hypothetical protein LBU38_01535 [Propionibacteriaceae bacterium]|jgi:hypothetical protein|nr:hypothetical protein [Propionibacteriaceae bacterium]
MKPLKRVLIVVLALLLVAGLGAGGLWLYFTLRKEPLPFTERCTASVQGHNTNLSVEQAYYSGIIAGLSIRRELKPRAASIALATAYQESGIRNLDYGHSDSIGLFQQRPSMGWGSIEEILDPWYSSKQFYKALVRVKNWDTKDINDAAQAVQRSGFPQAYRKHESNARALASSLTGETPAAFTCALGPASSSDLAGMKKYLTKTFGKTAQVLETETDEQPTLTVRADSVDHGWAVAQIAIAAASEYGVESVSYGEAKWQRASATALGWSGSFPEAKTDIVLGFAHG